MRWSRTGSAIDAHAAINTTSVYTAAGIFPMLPEKLSTNLTSLGEGDERLAIVVDMNVNDAGEVTASDVYRAVVRNHAKLAYNAVAAWLDGAGPAAAALGARRGPRRAAARAGRRRAASQAIAIANKARSRSKRSRCGRCSRRARLPTCVPTRRTARRS